MVISPLCRPRAWPGPRGGGPRKAMRAGHNQAPHKGGRVVAYDHTTPCQRSWEAAPPPRCRGGVRGWGGARREWAASGPGQTHLPIKKRTWLQIPLPQGGCATRASETAPDLGHLGTISPRQNAPYRSSMGGVSKDPGKEVGKNKRRELFGIEST